MGCGASKNSIHDTTITTNPKKPIKNEIINHVEKEILPGIKATQKNNAIAFEIPLDNLVTGSSKTLTSITKNSLPKLNISDKDVKLKLANAELKWNTMEDKNPRKIRAKPQLASSSPKDPELLKKKLLEKEAQAATNRKKEKEKLAAKILAQEKHAKTVLLRKKAMEVSSSSSNDESESVSNGGEQSESEKSNSSGSSEESDSNEETESSSAVTSEEDSPLPVKQQLKIKPAVINQREKVSRVAFTVPVIEKASVEIPNIDITTADKGPVKRVEKTPSHSAFSLSYDASFLVSFTSKKFYGLKIDSNNEFQLAGWGSGCDYLKDIITSILCIPVYIPSNESNSLIAYFIAVGYSNGFMKIYHSDGSLAFSQKWHNSALKIIKIRQMENWASCAGEADEVVLLFEDMHAVSIDGNSLWIFLRSSLVTETKDTGHPALTYKKWQFNSQSEINDIAILGSSSTSFLSPTTYNPISKKYSRTHYTARYLGVGHPILAFYATSEPGHSLSIASAMATKVTNAVTSAVFTFAKSMWSSPTNVNDPTIQSTEIKSLLTLNDKPRSIISITMAPPSATGKITMAALADNLGRVLIVDVDQGVIIRIFKGMRDAQVAWMQQRIEEKTEEGFVKRTILLLVIYSVRGTLEVFIMRYGPRITAIETERKLKLVQASNGMLGGSYWRMSSANSYLASCFLISPAGEMQKVIIPSEFIEQNMYNSVWIPDLHEYLVNIEKSNESDLKKCLNDLAAFLTNLCEPFQILQALKPISKVIALKDYIYLLNYIIQEIDEPKLLNELIRECFQNNQSITITPAVLKLQLLVHLKYANIYHELISSNLESGTDKDEECQTIINIIIKNFGQIEEEFSPPEIPEYNWDVFINQFKPPVEICPGKEIYYTFKNENPDCIYSLANFLICNWIFRAVSFKSIFLDFSISPIDIMRLIISFIGYKDLKSTNLKTLVKLWNLISLILDDSIKMKDFSLYKYLLSFSYKTSLTAWGLFFTLILESKLLQPEICNQDKLIRETKNLIDRISICWVFNQHIESELMRELELTAKTVGESEKCSITRLVAGHRVQSLKMSETGDKNALIFEKNLVDMYGYQINIDLLQVYLVFEFGRLWDETKDIQWLNRCVLTVGIISSNNLRNIVIVTIFSQFFSTKLENITSIIEKARRVPKDAIFLRMCGMSIDLVKKFLKETATLLEFIDIDSFSTPQYMLGSIEAAINQNSTSSLKNKSYYNDALGVMMGILQGKHGRCLSSRIVKDHKNLIIVLDLILKWDMKNVRPLKLFSPHVNFCTTFFETLSQDKEISFTNEEKLLQDRKVFLDKLSQEFEVINISGLDWEI